MDGRAARTQHYRGSGTHGSGPKCAAAPLRVHSPVRPIPAQRNRRNGIWWRMSARLALKILAAAAALALGLWLALSWLAAGRLRGAVADAVSDATGYSLTIAGDVRLRLFPPLSLELGDVRLRNPPRPQELASAPLVRLRVDPASVFRGPPRVREILVEGLHVNHLTDADGGGIWDADRIAEAGGGPAGFAIDRLRVRGARVDIQDAGRRARHRADRLELDVDDFNTQGRPFPVTARFDYARGGLTEPAPVLLSGDALIDGDSARVSGLRLGVAPMMAEGEATVSLAGDGPAWSGRLRAEPFDARALARTLGLAADDGAFDGSGVGQTLAFEASLEGDGAGVALPRLVLRHGGGDIEAEAAVRFATRSEPMSVSFQARTEALELSPGPARGAPASSGGEDGAAPAALPFDLIGAVDLQGSVFASTLVAGGVRLEDVSVFANIEDGVLDVELPALSAFGGSVSGNLRADARADPPRLAAELSAEGIDIGALAPFLPAFNPVAGALSVEAESAASGGDVEELLDSLSGVAAFSIEESEVDIGIVKQVFTAIAALSPSGEAIQQWPDVIRFGAMDGVVEVERGLGSRQRLALRMDNFDVAGAGGVDLAAGTFDYGFEFTMLGEPHPQTIPIGALYHDVAWPVRCGAALDDPVSRFCEPDFARVRETFARIAADALEEAADQAPESLLDSARRLLRSIFN